VTSLNDSDRQVSKAADESFHKVFDTEKKREILWENYSVDVFKYISDVLTNETAKTIS
jgi:E3 ubiquitin-protein ligase listerin